MNIPNLSIKPDLICITKELLDFSIKSVCETALRNKPIFFIIIAIIFDIIEYFIRNKFWNNNKILFQSKYYSIDTNELLIIISTGKTFCLIIALFFIIFGIKIYIP